MPEAVPKPRVKMKICAVGEETVGKTSLIRFVADLFEGAYVRTIGTLLAKKTVEVLNRLTKLNPNYPSLWWLKARVFEHMGERTGPPRRR